MDRRMLVPVVLLLILALIPYQSAQAEPAGAGQGEGEGIQVIYSPNGDGMGTLYITMQDPPAQEVSVFVYSGTDSHKVENFKAAHRFNVEIPELMNETYHLMVAITSTSEIVAECDILFGTMTTIVFDANGGTGFMSPISLEPGSKFTLPSNEFTAPEGMQFAGWSVVSGVEGEYQPGNTIYPEGQTTVKAIWSDLTPGPAGGDGGSGMVLVGAVIVIVLAIAVVFLYIRGSRND